MKLKFRKSQAAMEFMMTYGWAIFVVMTVIGVLAYYGVLDPQQFLPQKCQLYGQISCMDHKIMSTGGGIIRLNNGFENDINITNVTFLSETGIYCFNDTTVLLPVGASTNFDLSGETCTALELWPFEGARIKGTIEINYKDLQTMFEHIVYGVMSVDVEAG